MVRAKSLSSVLLFAGTLWALTLNLVLLPRLDVDTYHDGFIYPMALQSSNGYVPNKDYFSLYGPIGPTLSGLWLKSFGQSLLILRMYGAFLIVVIALLMFLILRKITNNVVSLIFCLVWLLGSPLIVHPSLPWVDLHTTLILLGSFYLLLNTRLACWPIQNKAIILGMFIGLGVFTKMNFGLVAVISMILIALHIGTNILLRIAFGALISGSLVVSFLLLSDALVPYFEQTIYYAWTLHDEGKSLRGAINIKSILFGTIVIVISYFLNKSEKYFIFVRRPYIRVVFVVFSCFIWCAVALKFRKIEEPFTTVTSDPLEALANLLKNVSYFPLFGSIFILLWLYASSLRSERVQIEEETKKSKLMIGILCLSYIVQLYPNPEPAHIWYIFPAVVIGISILVSLQGRDRVLTRLSKYLIGPTLFALATINFQFLSIPRINHSEVPLVGMISKPAIVKAVDDSLYKLDASVAKGPIIYNCQRGIYSVFSNTYFASDYQYVDIYHPYFKSKLSAELVFGCDLDASQVAGIKDKYEVIFETDSELSGKKNILYRAKNT